MAFILKKIVNRIAWLILALAVASVVVFTLLNLLPGDVAGVILGPNASADAVEAMRVQLGLNQPAYERYFSWVVGLFRFDLGSSALSGIAVAQSIGSKLAVTLSLVIIGMILAVAIALPAGMFAAVNRHNGAGVVVSVFSQLGMAIPAFLAGVILVIIFAVWLGWLPSGEYIALTVNPLLWAKHLTLPVLSIALVQSAVLTRYVRSAFIDVLTDDYFRTARAMGWRFWRGLWRHGIRNVAIQLITILGLQLTTLLVGAIVVEQVFNLPGLGTFLVSAVSQRDLPVVQSIVMLLVAIALIMNTIVDVAYLLIDPRLREAK